MSAAKRGIHSQSRVILSALSILLCGCRNPSGPIVLHTLSPLETPSPASASSIALEVMPVRIPELIQRPQLVMVQGPDRMGLSEFHHWGNALDEDIQRILAQDLSRLLGSPSIVAYPDGIHLKAPWHLQVDIQRFEGQPGGTLNLDAIWMLMGPQGAQAQVLQKTRIQETVTPDLDGLVQAHSRAIAQLSQEIATAIRGLK
jgi:uncharacterized lipoprotein YmbA